MPFFELIHKVTSPAPFGDEALDEVRKRPEHEGRDEEHDQQYQAVGEGVRVSHVPA